MAGAPQSFQEQLKKVIIDFTTDRNLRRALWKYIVMRRQIHCPISLSWLRVNLDDLAKLSRDPREQEKIVLDSVEKQRKGFRALIWQQPQRKKPDAPDCDNCPHRAGCHDGFYLLPDGHTMTPCPHRNG